MAKVAVVGKGNYAGTITFEFEISAKELVFDEDEKTEDRQFIVTVDENSKVLSNDEAGKAIAIEPSFYL